MKYTKKDALAVLRLFDCIDRDTTIRDLRDFGVTHPLPTNTLVSLVCDTASYAVLFDASAADDSEYIVQQMKHAYPDREVQLIDNPMSDHHTFGVPYKGKDVYVARVITTLKRLDIHLAITHPEYSRSSWQKFIKEGRVHVNETLATSAKQLVDDTSRITISLPKKPALHKNDLPVIYIDNDIVVFDKPVGMLTHQKNQRDTEPTVADFARMYASNLDGERAGIVHRLDRDTSGVIVCARTPEAFESLKQQFASRTIEKTYLALLDGHTSHTHAVLDLPLQRSASKAGTFQVNPQGKPAETEMQVTRTSTHYTYVQLHPKTGRTHQLRVHMAHIGTPIVGDRVYGTPADRLYLHAHSLTLKLPSTHTSRTFVSPVPPEFEQRITQDLPI